MQKRQLFILRVFCALFLLAQSFGTAFFVSAKEVSVSAESAILINGKTGEVLYSKNEHEKKPIASTTKIMTALLTFEQEHLDSYFEVNKEAITVEGSSIGLEEGDQVSLRVLGWGMLLRSGNDAANSAAFRIAGSQEKFSELMNLRAKEIGMENSNFITPSGLHDENHYSTAYDMALLTQEALKNQEFKDACSSTLKTLEYGNPPFERHLGNSNKLLKSYRGAIGVKTGFTKKAGRCLVSAAERDGLQLICVTLNDPDDWQDHQELLDYGFSKGNSFTVSKEEVQLKAPVLSGEKEEVSVAIESDKTIAYIGDKKPEQKVVFQSNLYAPIKKGQIIGFLSYQIEGKEVEQIPLLATEEIKRQEVKELSLSQKVGRFFASFIRKESVIVIFVIAVAVILVYRVRRKEKEKGSK